LEIDTDPPKSETGLSEKQVSFEDLAGKLERLQKQFNIPAELLE
jgi:hypothetical protein